MKVNNMIKPVTADRAEGWLCPEVGRTHVEVHRSDVVGIPVEKC